MMIMPPTDNRTPDHSNTPAGATAIALSESFEGRIDAPNDVDYFRVRVESPGTLTIRTTGNADPDIAVFDGAGNEVPGVSGSWIGSITQDILDRGSDLLVRFSGGNAGGEYTGSATLDQTPQTSPDLTVGERQQSVRGRVSPCRHERRGRRVGSDDASLLPVDERHRTRRWGRRGGRACGFTDSSPRRLGRTGRVWTRWRESPIRPFQYRRERAPPPDCADLVGEASNAGGGESADRRFATTGPTDDDIGLLGRACGFRERASRWIGRALGARDYTTGRVWIGGGRVRYDQQLLDSRAGHRAGPRNVRT